MKRFFAFFVIALLTLMTASGVADVDFQSPFEADWVEAPLEIAQGESFQTSLLIHVPEGHYLYADQIELLFKSLEEIRIDDIVYPPAIKKHDPFLGKTVEIYPGDVEIQVKGHVPSELKLGERELVAEIKLQGCTPKLCLRPESRELLLKIQVMAGSGTEQGGKSVLSPSVERAASTSSWRELLAANDFSEVMDRGFGWVLLIVFLGGILTSLTPCVWPLIPVVLLIVGVHPEHRIRRNLGLSLSLVAGMILVYAVLGITAAAFGKNLGFLFQSRMFLALISFLFIAMGLSMLGLFELQLPQRFRNWLHELGGKGYRGAFLAGLGSGVIASPCVGPVVAALLAYVALQKSYLLGFWLLVVFGSGMGLLFVLLGTGYATIADRVRGGNWMTWVKQALGLLLILPGIFYLGVLFGWDPIAAILPDEKSDIAWIESEPEALEIAEESRRPIMMDFYADWCPPCRELDRKFFTRDDIEKLSEQFVMIRVDATLFDEEVERVADKYSVIGWPTLFFLSPRGEVYSDLTVNDYAPKRIQEAMLEALRRADASEAPDEEP